MKVAVERFRGIEYVRISTLPEEERQIFWRTFDQQKVINILKADVLLNDCVLVKDFLVWQEMFPAGKSVSLKSERVSVESSHAA
ncbi:MAG: hypothetical protein JSU09_07330 [Bacteroidetes bacterium]|nr:hypothetical protein [Bacteroidota bacterium]